MFLLGMALKYHTNVLLAKLAACNIRYDSILYGCSHIWLLIVLNPYKQECGWFVFIVKAFLSYSSRVMHDLWKWMISSVWDMAAFQVTLSHECHCQNHQNHFTSNYLPWSHLHYSSFSSFLYIAGKNLISWMPSLTVFLLHFSHQTCSELH